MKIIIFGLGSIGYRHASILQKYFSHEVFVFRTGTKLGNDLSLPELTQWQQVEKLGAQVAFICNPTHEHISTALKCANLGMHLFIEKPLSNKLDGIQELEDICRGRNLSCYVAYCLRFHPVILKLKELLVGAQIHHVRVICTSLLHQWRPNSSKVNYSSYANQGGGVILDLSHEFDYIEFIFGKIASIKGIKAKRSHVTVDSEDFADAFISLSDGTPVNLHLNFLSRHHERSIKVDSTEGFFIADLVANQIVWEQNNGRREVVYCPIERDEYLRAQSEYFFDHLGNAQMMNNIAEAKILLGKILEFRND